MQNCDIRKGCKINKMNLFPIPKLCTDFVSGTCDQGPYCSFRHKLFSERLSDFVSICKYNNFCTWTYCSCLHITRDEENLFRNQGIIPSELAVRYRSMLSILIRKFSWKYVEQETSLLEMLSAGTPPEQANYPQQVPIQYFTRPSLPAPPPWSPINSTAYQQPVTTAVDAIQPQYPFPPPPLLPRFASRYGDTTQASPYTPLSSFFGAKRIRWNEPIRPRISAQVPVQTPMTVFAPPQSAPLRLTTNRNLKKVMPHKLDSDYSDYNYSQTTLKSPTTTSPVKGSPLTLPPLVPPHSPSPILSATTTSSLEPDDNKRRKIVQQSSTADSPRSSIMSVLRELPKALPSSPQTSPRHLSSTRNIMFTYSISSRRSSVMSVAREPSKAPSPPPSPQSLTTNTMISSKMSQGSNLVTTEDPEGKPPTITSRRSSAMSVLREPPNVPLPPPSLSPSLTSTTTSNKMSKGSDLVTTEDPEWKPPTISSRRSSVMSVAREPSRAPSPPPSPQSLMTNTMISNKMSQDSDLVTTEDPEGKPPTITSRRSSAMTVARESPTVPSPPPLPQKLTTHTFSNKISKGSDLLGTEPKALTVASWRSPVMSVARAALKAVPSSPSSQSLTINTMTTEPMTPFTSCPDFVEVKTDPKSPRTASLSLPAMSVAQASPLTSPQVAPPPPPPPPPPLPQPSSLQSSMTTFDSNSFDPSFIGTEIKTEPKSPKSFSSRSPAMNVARASPLTSPQVAPPAPPPPPPPLPQPSSLQSSMTTSNSNSFDPSFIGTEIKTEPKSPTTASPCSLPMNVSRSSPLASPQVAPPPPLPPLSSPQSLMTTSNSSDSSFIGIEVKSEPKSPTTVSLGSLAMNVSRASPLTSPQVAPPPPPPTPPPLPPLSSLQSSMTTSNSYSSDPSFIGTEIKTEPKSPTIASPRSTGTSVAHVLPHTELSHLLLAIKRKREDEPMSSTTDAQMPCEKIIASKRLKIRSTLEELLTLTAARANEVNISQNLNNTSLTVETSTSEIVAPIPMETSVDAALLASSYESPTPQSVPFHSPWPDIPWETIQQILSQEPPPPPQSENVPEISTDCKNGDQCGEKCTIEKFLLYDTVVHQTSLLRGLAQTFRKDPYHAVKMFGAKTCATVLNYIL